MRLIHLFRHRGYWPGRLGSNVKQDYSNISQSLVLTYHICGQLKDHNFSTYTFLSL